MNKDDLIIGVHGQEGTNYGQYDVLSSFSDGLLKAFKKKGVKAFWTRECFEKGFKPSLTIGFNVVFHENWPALLNANIPNIMWSVDSIFAFNFPVLKEFSKYDKFVLFSVTNCDQQPISDFFPNLNYSYLPHATDPELWQKKEVEKEYDIVLFSSILDYEKSLEDLKKRTPEDLFAVMTEMYNILLETPQMLFWELYQIFKKHELVNFNETEYATFFYDLAYIVMYAKKAQVVQHLSDFNLKVYGNGPWEKYVSGKVEYLGPRNLKESMDIMNKSKIILHPHSLTLELGLHERVLNASSIEAFVLSSDSRYIREAFGDSVGYYSSAKFEDLTQKVEYYLNNDEERTIMAKNAREIVLRDHTWDSRVDQILRIIGCS